MPNTFIIIKGQPKALQIEQLRMGDNAIREIRMDDVYRQNDAIYDLGGRKVQTMRKGLYIVNGQKFAVQ